MIRSKRLLVSLDAVAVVAIVTLSLHTTSQLSDFIDVIGSDETYYLWGGIHGVLPASFGILYGKWYQLLSFLEPDPLDLHYLSWRVTTAMAWASLFIALRSLGGSTSLALLSAWIFAVLEPNFNAWPRVGFFCLILVFTAISVASFFKNRSVRVACLSWAALLISYTRPEMFLAALFLWFCSVFVSWQSSDKLRLLNLVIAALMPILLLVLSFRGMLPFDSSSERPWCAFGQHFSFRMQQKSPEMLLNPWWDWEEIVRSTFGAARSPLEALWTNPGAVLAHIWANLLDLPGALKSTLITTTRLNVAFSSNEARSMSVLLAYIPWLVLVYLTTRHERNRKLSERQVDQLCFLGALLIPNLASLMIVFPHRQYLMVSVPIAFVLFAVIVFERVSTPLALREYVRTLVIGALVTYLSIPVTETLLSTKLPSAAGVPNKRTIEFLRGLKFKQPLRMIEGENLYGAYVSGIADVPLIQKKKVPFFELLNDSKVNIVVLSEDLLASSRLMQDKQWQEFLSNPEHFDFEALAVPGTNRTLLLRKDML